MPQKLDMLINVHMYIYLKVSICLCYSALNIDCKWWFTSNKHVIQPRVLIDVW